MSIAADVSVKVTSLTLLHPQTNNEPTHSARHNGTGGMAGDPLSSTKWHFEILTVLSTPNVLVLLVPRPGIITIMPSLLKSLVAV